MRTLVALLLTFLIFGATAEARANTDTMVYESFESPKAIYACECNCESTVPTVELVLIPAPHHPYGYFPCFKITECRADPNCSIVSIDFDYYYDGMMVTRYDCTAPALNDLTN